MPPVIYLNALAPRSDQRLGKGMLLLSFTRFKLEAFTDNQMKTEAYTDNGPSRLGADIFNFNAL